MPPALDLQLINELGRELHPSPNGVMAEDQVCPWTLFLTMALTLLKGVMPHVPKMLPVMIPDPETRERAAELLESEEFINNIDQYFLDNVKNDIQGPLNRQILKSSETVMYSVELLNGLINAFFKPPTEENNDLGTTDNRPRMNSDLSGLLGNGIVGQVLTFAKTMYDLSK